MAGMIYVDCSVSLRFIGFANWVFDKNVRLRGNENRKGGVYTRH